MRRRDLILGAGSLTALGGGTAVAFDVVGSDDESTVTPLEIETLDAPGSTAGTALVPELGRVTFVEMFATWCTICQSMMPDLAATHDAVDGDVQFLSVTNEPLGNTVTREDVTEWWVDNGGDWTVGVDPTLDLTRALDSSGVPYKFVLDEENRVVWRSRGRSSAEEMIEQIRDAS